MINHHKKSLLQIGTDNENLPQVMLHTPSSNSHRWVFSRYFTKTKQSITKVIVFMYQMSWNKRQALVTANQIACSRTWELGNNGGSTGLCPSCRKADNAVPIRWTSTQLRGGIYPHDLQPNKQKIDIKIILETSYNDLVWKDCTVHPFVLSLSPVSTLSGRGSVIFHCSRTQSTQIIS